MPSPYRSIPPLASLRTFEAVARKLSFTRAAEELALTQSAVSHQIRSLEEFLGCKVFRRLNPGVELTSQGQLLMEAVRSGLDVILNAADKIRGPQRVGVLTIAVPTAFASWWLVPRLGLFAALHPGIEIRIATMDFRRPDLARDGIDAAIVSRPADEAPLKNELILLREVIFPVCSPDLIKKPGKLVRTQELFDQYTLIEEDPPIDFGSNWEFWLKRLEVSAVTKHARLSFSHYGVALSAAVDGLGVALGRSPMVDIELRAGRLVRPFQNRVCVMAPSVYALTWPEHSLQNQRFLAFRDFVLDQSCGCELAAGPCGSPQIAQTEDFTGARAARRRAQIEAVGWAAEAAAGRPHVV